MCLQLNKNAEPSVTVTTGPSQQRGKEGMEVKALFTLISMKAFWEISPTPPPLALLNSDEAVGEGWITHSPGKV